MKADVIGLIEIENDGYGNLSTIRDLCDGRNAREDGIGLGNYSFMDPGSQDHSDIGLLDGPQSDQTESQSLPPAPMKSMPLDWNVTHKDPLYFL